MCEELREIPYDQFLGNIQCRRLIRALYIVSLVGMLYLTLNYSHSNSHR